MKYIGLVLVMILTFAFGCGPTITEGTNIDRVKRSEIVKGATPAQKVVELFGKPAKIEKVSSGGEKYIYNYYHEQFTHWWTLPAYDRQQLEVEIQDGIVQNYVFTREYRGLITEKDQ